MERKAFMKLFRFVLLVSLMLFSQIAEAELDKNSGLDIPDKLGDFRKTKVIDNEAQHPGFGTSIYYNTPGLKATVYIYNEGKKSITDGIEGQVVQDAFLTAKSEIEQMSRMGYYKLTSPISSAQGTIGTEKGQLKVLQATFSYQDKGQENNSVLYVFGRQNQIIKLRVSYLKQDEGQARPFLNRFLKAVAEWLTSDGSESAGQVLHLVRLGVSIPIPKGYTIVPESEWKSVLTLGQQFVMRNPTEFDYLIQKEPHKTKQLVPFEGSHFLIKYKAAREISDEEFKVYVQKYFLRWDEVMKERQEKGLISNLVTWEILEPPTVDYDKKTVILKTLVKLGEATKEIQFMYSAFYPSGNLVVTFVPASKGDQADFESVISKISRDTR